MSSILPFHPVWRAFLRRLTTATVTLTPSSLVAIAPSADFPALALALVPTQRANCAVSSRMSSGRSA